VAGSAELPVVSVWHCLSIHCDGWMQDLLGRFDLETV